MVEEAPAEVAALYLNPRCEFTPVLGSIALQSGATLVGRVAVLTALISVPLGAVAIQLGPWATKAMRGRRVAPAGQSPRQPAQAPLSRQE
jgi:hypothetical protein